jgi:6-pyruvoyltetrahydropterin/6-carboxytetrahydropterin synthase
LHFVTKTYGHDLGLSACFRQWRAKSHCRFLHGYPLSFKFTFKGDELDENGWLIDFGNLKPVKAWLEQTFDHKLLVAEDDPALGFLRELGEDRPGYVVDRAHMAHAPLADVIVVPRVGCEAFAEMAWVFVEDLLVRTPAYNCRVWLHEVEVKEHGANGVILRK